MNVWQGEFPGHNSREDGYYGTCPVGEFPANDYGLHNMSGNVWEWCADWFHANYHHRASERRDPKGPPSGEAKRDPGRLLPVSSVLLQSLPSRGARPKHAGQLDRQRRLPLRAIDPVSGGLAVADPRPVDMASEWARASRVVARQRAPGFRADLVRRPRLIGRLREARSAALVLLTAPAGYGKTTLLAEWAAEDDRPFVWVRPIDADNDPALFVASIIEALDEMRETSGDVPATLVEPEVPEVGVSTTLFSRLARAVRARRRPFVLVVDDVHLLGNPACLGALTVILDQLPGGAQVALASRTEPPLRLGRRRAHRGLVDLQLRDLAMTRSEGGELLARMGLKLSPADVVTLVRRAEGWPVAVYLAGLSLRGQRDVARAVARFAGADRLVVDYLRGTSSWRAVPTQARILDAHLGARHTRRPNLRRAARAIRVCAGASRSCALEHASRSTRPKRPWVSLPPPLRRHAQVGAPSPRA